MTLCISLHFMLAGMNRACNVMHICILCIPISFCMHTVTFNMHVCMHLQFTEDHLQLRCPESYEYQCSLLNGPLRDYDSTTYGINYRSPLNDIPGFHVANNQLPQDIMHVLFEGVLPLEVKLMLKEFITVKRFFDINFLNSRIDSFTFGKKELRNKPPKDLTIEGSLRLSGILIIIT